jgi:hypothetical protein
MNLDVEIHKLVTEAIKDKVPIPVIIHALDMTKARLTFDVFMAQNNIASDLLAKQMADTSKS